MRLERVDIDTIFLKDQHLTSCDPWIVYDQRITGYRARCFVGISLRGATRSLIRMLKLCCLKVCNIHGVFMDLIYP
jgi:hypothetical protein